MVLFAHHNVIKDPPFSHLDLIILPQPADLSESVDSGARRRDVPFRAAPGGYLFLGTSESPDGTDDLFLRVDKKRPHLTRAAR